MLNFNFRLFRRKLQVRFFVDILQPYIILYFPIFNIMQRKESGKLKILIYQKSVLPKIRKIKPI